MKSPSLKIPLLLLALFVSGGVFGVGVTRNLPVVKSAAQPWSEEALLERRFQEDVARLQLTAEQSAKLHAHYGELGSGIRGIREDTSKRIGALFVRHMKSVLPELTPEQRELYSRLSDERHAARR